MTSIRVETEVDYSKLVVTIQRDMNRAEIFDLIKALDAAVGDWGFTKSLRNHFIQALDQELMRVLDQEAEAKQ